MRSSKKSTIIFVAILLLFLLSFVTAELNKRDPQAPGDAPPADAPPKGGDAPPADAPPKGGDAPPADAPPKGGNAPPAEAPKGGDAGGKAAGDGGKAPPADAPAAPGGNQPGGNPSPGGNQPGGDPGAANNSTEVPKYVNPATPTVQVVMIQTKTSKNLLYRIGAKIEFKWGYSDTFEVPPKFIMVAAQPQVNTKTNYTISQNLTLSETQDIFWDTSTVPSLPMSQYKLIICDQDGPNAPPKPGGLQAYSALQFGLYTPQDPNADTTNYANNAISILIPISLLSNIGLALITIISFGFISI